MIIVNDTVVGTCLNKYGILGSNMCLKLQNICRMQQSPYVQVWLSITKLETVVILIFTEEKVPLYLEGFDLGI